MVQTTYHYNVTDFANDQFDAEGLRVELRNNSVIKVSLDYINTDEETGVDFVFTDELPVIEENALNSIVATHNGAEPPTFETYTELISTVRTSSRSYVDLPGMELNVGSGDFVVAFSGQVEPTFNNASAYIAIFKNDGKIESSERFNKKTLLGGNSNITSIIRINGLDVSDTIKVKWKVTLGSVVSNNRIFNAWRIK